MTNQEVITNYELDESQHSDTHLHPEEMSVHTKEELTEDFKEESIKAMVAKEWLNKNGFSNIKNLSNNLFMSADKGGEGIVIAIRNEFDDKDILKIAEYAVRNQRKIWFADVNLEDRTIELDVN